FPATHFCSYAEPPPVLLSLAQHQHVAAIPCPHLTSSAACLPAFSFASPTLTHFVQAPPNRCPFGASAASTRHPTSHLLSRRFRSSQTPNRRLLGASESN